MQSAKYFSGFSANWQNASSTWVAIASLMGFCHCMSSSLLAQLPNESSTIASSSNETEGYEARFPALGTFVDIKVFSTNAELVSRTVEAAERRTKEIEATLTDYDPNSEASKLTENAHGESFVVVSEDLWNMLAASDLWYKQSGGAFDASLGSLTRQWRSSRRTKQSISDEQRQQALLQSGWKNVELNASTKSVRFRRDGIRLDFGAIGKGYVVDEIFELFRKAGLKQCLINISGNMRFGDAPPERMGWRIEIAPLEKGQPILRRLLLANTSIATSGDLWQFTLIDGERHSHILDPRTGKSVRGPIASTIITPSAADADACATAVCVLGPVAGAQLVQSLPQTEALILEHSDADLPVRYIATEGFAKSK